MIKLENINSQFNPLRAVLCQEEVRRFAKERYKNLLRKNCGDLGKKNVEIWQRKIQRFGNVKYGVLVNKNMGICEG